MDIRTLAGVGMAELADAFNTAFADYAVPMTMTAASLAAMQQRRGYVAEASFGAYDGERLVAFALTCLDGDRAYNSGTGVAPAYRGRGLARRLVDAVIERVPHRTYVLEVLAENANAIALYRSCGFVETRRLQSWTYAPAQPAAAPELAHADLAAIAARGDVELAWQNSLASLARATDPYVVLGDAHAAAVVFPESADLPLLAVDRAHLRRGHGIRLLAAAAARASRPLRIINVDARAEGIAAFLTAVGATPLGQQLEMARG